MCLALVFCLLLSSAVLPPIGVYSYGVCLLLVCSTAALPHPVSCLLYVYSYGVCVVSLSVLWPVCSSVSDRSPPPRQTSVVETTLLRGVGLSSQQLQRLFQSDARPNNASIYGWLDLQVTGAGEAGE